MNAISMLLAGNLLWDIWHDYVKIIMLIVMAVCAIFIILVVIELKICYYIESVIKDYKSTFKERVIDYSKFKVKRRCTQEHKDRLLELMDIYTSHNQSFLIRFSAFKSAIKDAKSVILLFITNNCSFKLLISACCCCFSANSGFNTCKILSHPLIMS